MIINQKKKGGKERLSGLSSGEAALHWRLRGRKPHNEERKKVDGKTSRTVGKRGNAHDTWTKKKKLSAEKEEGLFREKKS